MLKISKKSAGAKSSDAAAPSRQDCVAEAAYYRAECRGFAPGGELQDWFEAESGLDASSAPKA